MNTHFNLKYKTTEENIEEALFSLLRIRNYNDISIKELCYEAGINRSSFYSHYQDINDLMMKTEEKLSQGIGQIFNPKEEWENNVFVKLFEFLYKYKNFYKSYLGVNEQTFMERNDFIKFINIVSTNNKGNFLTQNEKLYHMAFFAGGLKALAKSWIQRDCPETPTQMAKILLDEYKSNSKYFN